MVTALKWGGKIQILLHFHSNNILTNWSDQSKQCTCTLTKYACFLRRQSTVSQLLGKVADDQCHNSFTQSLLMQTWKKQNTASSTYPLTLENYLIICCPIHSDKQFMEYVKSTVSTNFAVGPRPNWRFSDFYRNFTANAWTKSYSVSDSIPSANQENAPEHWCHPFRFFAFWTCLYAPAKRMLHSVNKCKITYFHFRAPLHVELA